ncbi:MAG: hypothetical protein V4730_05830 [Pseudomonadota bacterium]
MKSESKIHILLALTLIGIFFPILELLAFVGAAYFYVRSKDSSIEKTYGRYILVTLTAYAIFLLASAFLESSVLGRVPLLGSYIWLGWRAFRAVVMLAKSESPL